MDNNRTTFKKGKDNEEVVQKSKRRRSVDWQPDWLRDDNFKHWLDPNQKQVTICKYCAKDIKFTQKSDLIAHGSTEVHKDNIAAAMKQGSFQPIVVEGASFYERVAKAEITTSVFASNHNIGIRFVNDLVPYVQKLAIDPEATRHMKLKEDKCKQIIKNVFL